MHETYLWIDEPWSTFPNFYRIFTRTLPLYKELIRKVKCWVMILGLLSSFSSEEHVCRFCNNMLTTRSIQDSAISSPIVLDRYTSDVDTIDVLNWQILPAPDAINYVVEQRLTSRRRVQITVFIFCGIQQLIEVRKFGSMIHNCHHSIEYIPCVVHNDVWKDRMLYRSIKILWQEGNTNFEIKNTWVIHEYRKHENSIYTRATLISVLLLWFTHISFQYTPLQYTVSWLDVETR